MKVLEKGHITDTALENYSLDHLAEPDLGVVEEHILICPTCQDRLSEVDDFVRAFRTAHSRLPASEDRGIQPAPPSDFPAAARQAPPLWFVRPAVWAGLAATLAVIFAVFSLMPAARTAAPDPPQLVTLVAQRGAGGVTDARPGRLALHLDLRGLPPGTAAVEVTSWDGRRLWSTEVSTIEDTAIQPSMRFNAGQYWVRVRAAGTGMPLLREFGLRVVAP